MASEQPLVDRLEELLSEIEQLPDPGRERVFEFLEALDGLHRAAVEALAAELDEDLLAGVAARRPEVSWLLFAYGVIVDQRPEAEAAVEAIHPSLIEAGAEVTVLEARQGVVRVRMVADGSVSELARRLEEALRAHMPTFDRLELEPPSARPAAGSGGIALPIHHVDPRGEER